MESTMPRKQATSFRLSSSTLTLLKQLAEKENRSLTNMVEVLIQNKGDNKVTDLQTEFETWATSKGINLTKSHDGTYVYRPAFYAFLGWSESRGLSTSFSLRVMNQEKEKDKAEDQTEVQTETLNMGDI